VKSEEWEEESEEWEEEESEKSNFEF